MKVKPNLHRCDEMYIHIRIYSLTCIVILGRRSMTENGDPYEIALAERMNGIIKT